MYQYKAKLLRIIDGDTVEILIDLGFRITRQEVIRLASINTCELNDKDVEKRALAVETKQRIAELLANPDITINSFKPYKQDKYGRWLAEIFNSDGINVNQKLLEENLAEVYS